MLDFVRIHVNPEPDEQYDSLTALWCLFYDPGSRDLDPVSLDGGLSDSSVHRVTLGSATFSCDSIGARSPFREACLQVAAAGPQGCPATEPARAGTTRAMSDPLQLLPEPFRRLQLAPEFDAAACRDAAAVWAVAAEGVENRAQATGKGGLKGVAEGSGGERCSTPEPARVLVQRVSSPENQHEGKSLGFRWESTHAFTIFCEQSHQFLEQCLSCFRQCTSWAL